MYFIFYIIFPLLYYSYLMIISEIRIIVCIILSLIWFSFLLCLVFWGRVMGSRIYRFLCYFLLGYMVISFYVCFLGISLLYKDNDLYVVIGISFFILCLLFLGSVIISRILCSFIFHIWWLCDMDFLYHCYFIS